MVEIGLIVVALSTAALCMLLGATVYESVVMAPNFAHGKTALEGARAFLTATNPGNFFRILSPLTQAMLLLSVALIWSTEPSSARWFMITAFVVAIGVDVITYKFHYPRNKIMFVDPLEGSSDALQKVARQWARGNYVRMFLLAVSAFAAFATFYQLLHSIWRT